MSPAHQLILFGFLTGFVVMAVIGALIASFVQDRAWRAGVIEGHAQATAELDVEIELRSAALRQRHAALIARSEHLGSQPPAPRSQPVGDCTCAECRRTGATFHAPSVFLHGPARLS